MSGIDVAIGKHVENNEIKRELCEKLLRMIHHEQFVINYINSMYGDIPSEFETLLQDERIFNLIVNEYCKVLTFNEIVKAYDFYKSKEGCSFTTKVQNLAVDSNYLQKINDLIINLCKEKGLLDV